MVVRSQEVYFTVYLKILDGVPTNNSSNEFAGFVWLTPDAKTIPRCKIFNLEKFDKLAGNLTRGEKRPPVKT